MPRLLPLLLLSACGAPAGDSAAPAALVLPADAAPGDEIVLAVTLAGDGDWAEPDAPGTLLEARLGANRARHVVVPGGVGAVSQRVALGAWDGGEVALSALEGDADALDAAIAAGEVSLAVDPSAADAPLLGTYDASWSNDAPLLSYAEDGLWTWVFTDEDGGTGLLPTLLMAAWGRPVDIEGLWDAPSGTIQTTDHAWVSFDGAWEGTHPLFQVVTYNGLIGPLDDSPYLLAPLPVAFATDGQVPRERVLDMEPWVLAASWAEARREGLVAEDGGQDDAFLGAPDDYLFLDFVVEGASVSFEAEVAGAWWSSLNGFPSEGLTGAAVGGIGRTCIELPPDAGVSDVTALRVRAHEGAGTVAVRGFHYAPDAFDPREVLAVEGVTVPTGGTADLWRAP